MQRKMYQFGAIFAGVLAMVLLLSSLTVQATTAPPDGASTAQRAAPAYTYTRVLTVTTTADDGGADQRCEQGYTCTLRRAINEVRWHQTDAETYLIKFDLPTTDTGYLSTLGVWVFDVSSDATGDVFAYRDFGTYGHVIIDGDTQLIGRSGDPRIILRGDNNKGAFTLTGGQNIVRGLAFQGFGDTVVSVPGTDSNIIEDNWFGLTITGTEIYLRDPDNPEAGSGETGIYVLLGSESFPADSNTIQRNALAGFDGGAIAVDGESNAVLSNTIGTRADGTVPTIRPERFCRPNARYHNWFGGAGIQVYGDNQVVRGNRVVALLYQSADPFSTPEDAISATGTGHQISDNIIGLDAASASFGTCGEGIHVGGSGGGHYVTVMTNTIVGSQGEAGVFVTGATTGYDLDAVTVGNNIIKAGKTEAFAFGPEVPDELKLFRPAAITAISGTLVTGTAGAGSPCPNCFVELFLDEVDTVTETLASLAVVQADSGGNWTATLTRTLALTEGIRTASTTAADDVIPHPQAPAYVYHSGTTVRVSPLYTQTGAPTPTEPPLVALTPPLDIPAITFSAAPTQPTAFTTVITVTTTADPDDSASATCTADPFGPPAPAADGMCTFRRALVEADAIMDENPAVRPILIKFDIPLTDTGYISNTGVWVIQLFDTNGTDVLPTLGSTDINASGQVVIDGTTQPDPQAARPDGPRIVLRGPLNTDPAGIALTINGEHNVVRGLAFQKVRYAIQLNHSYNTVEDTWFGLTVTGTGFYLRDSQYPEEGTGSGGVSLAANSGHNLIQNNVFLGLTGAAINLQNGTDNIVLDNFIGTRADGTIDVAAVDPANICSPTAATGNWFGGEGINVRGKRNQVISNTLAGLLLQGGALQTPPDAINISGGQDNLIQFNRIGMDATGAAAWTCGAGVDMASTSFNRVLSNTIVNSYGAALFENGEYTGINANMMRGNVISGSVTAVEFGDIVPDPLLLFEPPRAGISGTTVTGNGGDTCPFCWIDLYLDDADSTPEAISRLGTVVADANGDWSFELPEELAQGEGVTLMATTRNYGVISYFEAGTSSRLSDTMRETQYVYLPLILK